MALYDTALEYLRNSRPACYWELRKARRLDAHIDGRIKAAQDYAAALIAVENIPARPGVAPSGRRYWIPPRADRRRTHQLVALA